MLTNERVEEAYDQATRQLLSKQRLQIITNNQAKLDAGITQLQLRADECSKKAKECAKTDRDGAKRHFMIRQKLLANIAKMQAKRTYLDQTMITIETRGVTNDFKEAFQTCKTQLDQISEPGGTKAINDVLDDFAVTVNDADDQNNAMLQTPGTNQMFTDDEIESEFDAFLAEGQEEDLRIDAPGAQLPSVPTGKLQVSSAPRQRREALPS